MGRKTFVAFVLSTVLVAASSFAGVQTINAFATEPDETKFCGSGSFVSSSETISYARKETTEYSINGNLPNYTMNPDETICANVAGAVLVGYYDRFNENLVPNYKTYSKIGSMIRYKKQVAEIDAVINELYGLMRTDTEVEGTTFNGFQNGMKMYAQAHGSSYISEDIGNLNFSKYKSAVESDTPVALFVLEYSLLDSCNSANNTDIITSAKNNSAHVVVGCGYKIETYYSANGSIITQRTYLKVASGLVDYNIKLLCLDGKSNIERAVSVKLL